MAKKYIEVINNGQEDLYVYDKEAQQALLNKAPLNHNHDSRYYTESEIDAKMAENRMHTIDIDNLTPSSTFTAGDVLGINGILYKAKVDTDEFPVTMVVDGGQLVYDEDADGNRAYVVSDPTLSEDWMKFADAGINYSLGLIDNRLTYFNSLRIANRLSTIEGTLSTLQTQLATIGATLLPVTIDGTTYTVRDILTELAKLMNKNIVIDEGENQDANSEE